MQVKSEFRLNQSINFQIKSIKSYFFKIIQQRMGSNNSKADSLHFDPKDWHETDRSVLHEVMRNSKGQQANLYHFNIKSDRQIDDEVEVYARRKSAASNWVQVLGANLTSSGFGFCGSQENANVLTEAIPVLLSSVSRLNKQQSAIVLFNALKGYSDLSKFVVPGAITQSMIGFNSNGNTKVWVNENFGMNHPTNQSLEATFDEAHFLDNFVNAVSSKLDFAHDFWNGLRSSRTLENALGFVRANGGISDEVLRSNSINIAGFSQQRTAVLNSNVVVQPSVCTTVVPPVQRSTLVSNVPVYQPVSQTLQTGYVNSKVNFVHNYGAQRDSNVVGFQQRKAPLVPAYQPVQNKFSFTSASQ